MARAIFILFQRDAKATDLFETFSACGLIREIRMMFEFSNQNRGFCFISYMDEVNASREGTIRCSDWPSMSFS